MPASQCASSMLLLKRKPGIAEEDGYEVACALHVNTVV